MPDDETFYAALAARDPEYEGVFYVGVRTTGVFCRPTCPARPPKRENCEFFRDAQQALLASYRPCQRCRPLSLPDETSDVVRRLVDAVERTPDKRWRDADFDALDVHASTARRQFRKRFGMTFAAYARARRLGAAFKAIRAGERVIAAQLEAGYESGSGFRDAFAKIMGAPPASGAARALFAAWLDTPLGPMTAIGDEEALYLLEYVDRRGLERQHPAHLRAGAARDGGDAPALFRRAQGDARARRTLCRARLRECGAAAARPCSSPSASRRRTSTAATAGGSSARFPATRRAPAGCS